MKNNSVTLFFISVAMCIFSGCEAIETIFKAGVWSGVLLVVGIIALIIFAVSKIGGGDKG